MAIPDISIIEAATRKLVHNAVKQGTTDQLTPRLIREQLEKQFSLEKGSLDEYKTRLKDVSKEALAEDPSPVSEAEEVKPKRITKKKSDAVVKAKEESISPPKSAAKRKVSATKAPKEKATEVKRRQRKDNKALKSDEHIPTSDVDMDEPQEDAEPVTKDPSESPPDDVKPPPSKRRKVVTSDEKEEDKPNHVKPTSSTSKAEKDMPEDEAMKSESELSVLIDEPPKRKRKSKATEKVSKATKKTSAKASVPLDKDEETIKRLKALVNACGVRKVWSKIFRDDPPKQQIKKLKEILAELGMTGRLSMEQAKVIKEKRELEKELEDVKQFEQAVVGRSSRGRNAVKQASMEEESSSEKDGRASEEDKDEDEDEEVGPRRKRPSNAARSIMAFLEDQSDSD
ncbi:hypothetical protein BDQ12DRAFT_681065 [Crucibulum laeve]|uniref:Uncharacterized protein n=1 Tax=Crucibulum laeve TaxID=68775 RepID=A0A5C3M501_9AGAR|nr:hypothetical protein BDQ12DRAFT_681065 [Crucibulum laeve]